MTAAVSGDYGKPRPALVVQADAFLTLPSVTVLLLSSEILPAHLARIVLEPSHENGLHARSQIMIDKAMTVPREKIGGAFGRLGEDAMGAVDRALIGFLGLGD